MKHITYDVLVCQDDEGRFLLEQRTAEGLLANLWQFPMFEHGKDSIDTFINDYAMNVQSQEDLLTFKHVFHI